MAPPFFARVLSLGSARMRALASVLVLVAGCMGDVGAIDAPAMSPPYDGQDPDGDFSQQTAYAAEKCPGGRAHPLASGLRIRELAIYQTLKIPLYEGGRWASRNIPLVQGKRALVRIAVEPLAGYRPHEVRGVVRLHNGDQVSVLVDKRTIAGPSEEGDLATTFNVLLSDGMLAAGTRISVALEEADCDAEAGARADTVLPEEGSRELEATRFNKLRIVLVPMSANGKVPVLGKPELDKLSAALRAFYPISEVELTVREPIDGLQPVPGPKARPAWDEQLARVKDVRDRDEQPSDVYYVGVFQPTRLRSEYCPDCILGVALQLKVRSPRQQAAVCAFFGDDESYETIVHELGHSHGIGHAPCDGAKPAEVDPAYPLSGEIESWGWDMRTRSLVPPSYKDIMSYCEPNWIHPTAYRRLAARNLEVGAPALAFTQETTRWRSALVHASGRGRWSAAVEHERPGGTAEPASVLDAAGKTLAQIEVIRVAIADGGGEFIYVPEPTADWAALRLRDRTVKLGDIAPVGG